MRSGTRRNRVMARTRQQNEAGALAHRLPTSLMDIGPPACTVALLYHRKIFRESADPFIK